MEHLAEGLAPGPGGNGFLSTYQIRTDTKIPGAVAPAFKYGEEAPLLILVVQSCIRWLRVV